jgi:hypothetical protein
MSQSNLIAILSPGAAGMQDLERRNELAGKTSDRSCNLHFTYAGCAISLAKFENQIRTKGPIQSHRPDSGIGISKSHGQPQRNSLTHSAIPAANHTGKNIIIRKQESPKKRHAEPVSPSKATKQESRPNAFHKYAKPPSPGKNHTQEGASPTFKPQANHTLPPRQSHQARVTPNPSRSKATKQESRHPLSR